MQFKMFRVTHYHPMHSKLCFRQNSEEFSGKIPKLTPEVTFRGLFLSIVPRFPYKYTLDRSRTQTLRPSYIEHAHFLGENNYVRARHNIWCARHKL